MTGFPRISIAKTVATKVPQNSFSLYIENDEFAGGDNQYTSGLELTWSRFGLSEFPQDAWLHKWLYPVIRLLGMRQVEPGAELALTASLVQNIFTPEDIEAKELVEDDRPYAGITFLELGYHLRREKVMDSLAFYGGIVGPHSYAEQVQSVVHDAVNGIEPEGWDNQLDDEPALGVVYEFKKKIAASGNPTGWGYDILFNTGGALGNVHTYYHIGGTFRWGWNLPDDFGFSSICLANYPDEPDTGYSRGPRLGVHMFLSADGRAVIRNLFLDGNTFSDSHSVDKKPLVGYLTGGVGLVYGRVKTHIAYVYQSREFEGQDAPQVYGSLNLTILY